MDLITVSLQEYLKAIKLRFHTKGIGGSDTSTNIQTVITGVNIPMSILVDITPAIYSIKVSVIPFIMIESKSIKHIKTVWDSWDEKGKLAKIIFNEESCIGKCYSLQLCCNILSDANGLTRTLWDKYFGHLFKEAVQVCQSIYNIKNVTDDIDILSV